jgi:hypothetical protein
MDAFQIYENLLPLLFDERPFSGRNKSMKAVYGAIVILSYATLLKVYPPKRFHVIKL